MGILAKKWNEAELLDDLNPLLESGERLLAGVYCTYQDYGFLFSSKHVIAGYIGLTDRARLIGTRYGIILHETFAVRLDRTAVSIQEMPFGAVHLRISDPDARLGRQRITYSLRAENDKFPSHFASAALITQTVQEYARQNVL